MVITKQQMEEPSEESEVVTPDKVEEDPKLNTKAALEMIAISLTALAIGLELSGPNMSEEAHTRAVKIAQKSASVVGQVAEMV